MPCKGKAAYSMAGLRHGVFVLQCICTGYVVGKRYMGPERQIAFYILKNQLFALKYTLKHSLIKIISTPTTKKLVV